MNKEVPFIEACVINYISSVIIRESKCYLTTLEIQDALAEIAEFSLNDIAQAMHKHGFKIECREDGSPAWAIIQDLNI